MVKGRGRTRKGDENGEVTGNKKRVTQNGIKTARKGKWKGRGRGREGEAKGNETGKGKE